MGYGIWRGIRYWERKRNRNRDDRRSGYGIVVKEERVGSGPPLLDPDIWFIQTHYYAK